MKEGCEIFGTQHLSLHCLHSIQISLWLELVLSPKTPSDSKQSLGSVNPVIYLIFARSSVYLSLLVIRQIELAIDCAMLKSPKYFVKFDLKIFLTP